MVIISTLHQRMEITMNRLELRKKLHLVSARRHELSLETDGRDDACCSIKTRPGQQ